VELKKSNIISKNSKNEDKEEGRQAQGEQKKKTGKK